MEFYCAVYRKGSGKEAEYVVVPSWNISVCQRQERKGYVYITDMQYDEARVRYPNHRLEGM